MKNWIWLGLFALLPAAAAAGPPLSGVPRGDEAPLSSADLDRASDILIYRWNKCTIDASKRMAGSALPTEAVPIAAAKACSQARENWIESQVSGGLTRAMVESTADHTEHCLFPMITGFVNLIRRGAAKDEIVAWGAQKRSC